MQLLHTHSMLMLIHSKVLGTNKSIKNVISDDFSPLFSWRRQFVLVAQRTRKLKKSNISSSGLRKRLPIKFSFNFFLNF